MNDESQLVHISEEEALSFGSEHSKWIKTYEWTKVTFTITSIMIKNELQLKSD
jgi:hypothetical protein